MLKYAVHRPWPLAHLKPTLVAQSFLLTSHAQRPYSGTPSPYENLIYPDSPTTNHWNLATFLCHAELTGLDRRSTVYVGTHYEYTVALSLAHYGFHLKRVGGAGDFGTDLLGTWTISPTNSAQRHMRVLMQCKAGAAQKTGPQHIRELEGALAAAPPGWRGDGVLAMLATQKPATKGVRDAISRSKLPMGFIACSKDGAVLQMLWNRSAENAGLQGVGVTARHVHGDEKPPELVLQVDGRTLPVVN